MKNLDHFFMNLALEEAKKAYQKNEVPVGAVLSRGDKLLCRAHNLREKHQNLLGHAELLVLKKAGQKLKSWRLEDCRLYVSLEPCLMCMGAIIQSRIPYLMYACPDPKGGFSSRYALNKGWTHKIKIKTGIGSKESSLLLKSFF